MEIRSKGALANTAFTLRSIWLITLTGNVSSRSPLSKCYIIEIPVNGKFNAGNEPGTVGRSDGGLEPNLQLRENCHFDGAHSYFVSVYPKILLFKGLLLVL